MLALATAAIDFGYPWWLSYGHLPVLVAAVAVGLLGYRPSSRLIMAMIFTKQRQHIKPARDGAAAKQQPQ